MLYLSTYISLAVFYHVVNLYFCCNRKEIAYYTFGSFFFINLYKNTYEK